LNTKAILINQSTGKFNHPETLKMKILGKTRTLNIFELENTA